ncbi:hypothetical protein ACWOFR_03530 [Carnobacterium gallinarum]
MTERYQIAKITSYASFVASLLVNMTFSLSLFSKEPLSRFWTICNLVVVSTYGKMELRFDGTKRNVGVETELDENKI